MSVVIQNLYFSYGKDPVLQDISFRADYGELWSVLGPNGAGKSTQLQRVREELEKQGYTTYMSKVNYFPFHIFS